MTLWQLLGTYYFDSSCRAFPSLGLRVYTSAALTSSSLQNVHVGTIQSYCQGQYPNCGNCRKLLLCDEIKKSMQIVKLSKKGITLN